MKDRQYICCGSQRLKNLVALQVNSKNEQMLSSCLEEDEVL